MKRGMIVSKPRRVSLAEIRNPGKSAILSFYRMPLAFRRVPVVAIHEVCQPTKHFDFFFCTFLFHVCFKKMQTDKTAFCVFLHYQLLERDFDFAIQCSVDIPCNEPKL